MSTPTTASKWMVLYCSYDSYLRIQHVDHPGYITIRTGDEGFILDVWSDVGDESEARTYAFYADLEDE